MADGERSPRSAQADIAVEVALLRLGPRGDGFRFSPAGAVATFGLPVRKRSWVRDLAVHPGCLSPARQRRAGALASMLDLEVALAAGEVRNRANGAPLVEEQVEMLRLLLEGEESRRYAALEVTGLVRQLESMLDFWRDMPPMPDEPELERASVRRPLEFRDEPPSPAPAVGREEMRQAARAEAVRRTPEPASGPAVVVGVLVAAAIAVALEGTRGVPPAAGVALGVLPGMAAAAALLGIARWRSVGRAVREAVARVDLAWPAIAERQAQAAQAARAAWEQRLAEAAADWEAAEDRRLDRLARLRAGEAAATRDALRGSLADLDFPSESACQVATDGTEAWIAVEVPPIDELVPRVRPVVDSDFQVDEEPVPDVTRTSCYLEHVAGVALLVARTALAAAPRLARTQVAVMCRSPGTEPSWLLDASVDRASVGAIEPASVDPASFLAGRGARVRADAVAGLSPLPEPRWVTEWLGPAAGRRAPTWRN